jgi:ABC-type Mn2+/Zn2+ transport system ATPase subunit
VREAIAQVGLAHLLEQLDADEAWDQVLSGGEKQRLGFARMLIQEPTLIVMDEATSALDASSQADVMRLVLERLPQATVVSVAHRHELEAFHTRKLLFEHREDGARLVRDEALLPTFVEVVGPGSRDHARPVRRPRPAHDVATPDVAAAPAHAAPDGFPSYAATPAFAQPA